MRNAFAQEITAIAATNDKVVLLSGDIGNRLFDDFKELAPDRFFNCGAAEANMMTVAAGMALSGLRPVVYTITPFVTTRCLEQIRNDVCYQRAPVTIVGVGSGLGYASLGPTHQSMEDIALLRTMPGLNVICPGDPWEVKAAIRSVLDIEEPSYIRLGKKGEPAIHSSDQPFEIGRSTVLRTGSDVCLISTGTATANALRAAEQLATVPISVSVVHMHTVKPLDTRALDHVFHKFPIVASLEEHGLVGGMGSAIAEWLSDQEPGLARLHRFGGENLFLHEAGDRNYVQQKHGLLPEQIAQRLARSWDASVNCAP